MKKYSLNLFIFLLTFQCVFSQKAPIKLGDIDEKEVKATQHEKFPDAEAVVLCDYGNIRYDLSGNSPKLVFEHIKRIKILKKIGYEHANRTIPFETHGSNREKVSNIKGYTYNFENGKVEKIKLEKNAILDKMIDKNSGETKFSMPNVKEGSVIEYSYEIRSDFWWHIPVWYFQNQIPTVWSEYRVSLPEYFNFVKLSQVYKEFSIDEKSSKTESVSAPQGGGAQNTKYENDGNRWVMHDVLPFKDEQFIASPNDHIMKMEFQLSAINSPGGSTKRFMETWEKLIKDLTEHDKYGVYLAKNLPDKALVQGLIADKPTKKDKATAIYDYVKHNIKYTKQTGIYTKRSLKDVLEKKVGNNAEINLLLVNMLREAGLEAYPVLLSTRPHGKIFEQYPIESKFNYTIVYLNTGINEELLLDATDPILPMGMISYNALNGKGLLVEPSGKASWINLQLSKFTKTSNIVLANLNMDAKGVVKGEISSRFGGYEAIKKRQKLLKDTEVAVVDEAEEGEEVDKESPTDEAEDKKTNKMTFKNIKEFDKPLDGVMQIETSEYSQLNDDFIYLTPLLEYRMKENPLKSETRLFPVDYACATEQSFYMNFIIPEGYEVEELPKPIRIKWEDGTVKYDYTITAIENKIQLMSKFVLTRPVFQANEYKFLRELYAQIVAKQEEQIVLKKK